MSESSHGELAPLIFGAGFGGFRAPLVTISKFFLFILKPFHIRLISLIALYSTIKVLQISILNTNN